MPHHSPHERKLTVTLKPACISPRRSPTWTVALATATCLSAAHGAQIAAPGAGTLLQQVPALPSRSSQPPQPPVSLEPTTGQGLTEGVLFELRTVLISGNTVFDSDTLRALLADATGKRTSLRQLETLAGRITSYYRSAGYPLARALVPAQTIADGAVRIEVIEARLGAVRLDNRSAVSNDRLESFLAPLRSGSVISQASIERPLILISELAGVSPSASIRAGKEVGTSDLDVRIDPGARWTGRAQIDNQGNRYTGLSRASADVSYFNPLNRGDAVTASMLSSGPRLTSGRMAYVTPVGSSGTRLTSSLSNLRYALGSSAESLQAHGDASTGSLLLTHPLRLGTDWNLRADAQTERLNLSDRVDSTGIRSDRRVNGVTVRLRGDVIVSQGETGQIAWLVGITRGTLSFTDATAAATDAASARTAGSFGKVEAQVLASRPLYPGATLSVTLRGQQAQGNLDASQKISLGGPNAVRAYDVGSLSGDSAYLLSLEWRQELQGLATGAWQMAAFVDSGQATVNQQPWKAGLNTVRLNGAGVRLTWVGPEAWQARLTAASPLGKAPEITGVKRGTRVWAELVKDF